MYFRILLLGYLNYRSITTLLLFLIPCLNICAQEIKGTIIYEKDSTPISFASVKLLNHNNGSISDSNGNFSLMLQDLDQSDTILISSVGFESLKIPIKKALLKSKFVLQGYSKNLESIIIKSFSKEDIAGAKSDIVGYYRSWNTRKTRGEIGRSFILTYKEYQIAKVRFKIYSNCDNNIIRLHIREIINGQPGKELLTDSVAILINKATLADKTYEFELNKYNIVLTQKNILVSFEVIEGTKSDYTSCSLSFVGSELGNYLYKSSLDDYWHFTNDYAIFMKVFFKYDE